jgi:hypothetical protein
LAANGLVAIERSNFIAGAAQCETNNHAHGPSNPGDVSSTLGGSQSKCWTPMIWRYGTRSIG